MGRELAREDPRDLFERARGDIGFGELGGEEVDFKFFGGGGVVVADTGDFDALG